MDGLLRIFKLIKTRKEQNLGRGKFRLYILRQLHTVHIRHLNIRQNHIRLKFLHHFQRLDAIIGKSDHREAQPFPINFPPDGLKHLFLIIHQKHRICIHTHSPFINPGSAFH